MFVTAERKDQLELYLREHGPLSVGKIDRKELGYSVRMLRYVLIGFVTEGRVKRYKDFRKDMRHNYYAVVADPGDALAVRAQEIGVQIPAMAYEET